MNPNEMTADEMPFISQLRSQIESILLVIEARLHRQASLALSKQRLKKSKPCSKKSAPN